MSALIPRSVFALFVLASMAGCERDPGNRIHGEVARLQDPSLITRGKALFARHCASCHGIRAEGSPDWRHRDANGFFPPPPLNGTAHAWHHPLQDLRNTIRRGSPPGQGRMPAWGGARSDEDIDALIAWIQFLWSAEVYAAWLEIDQRARKR